MQNKHSRHTLLFFVLLFLFLVSCKNDSATDDQTAASGKEAAMTAGVSTTDMNQVRSEIQAIENQWADAMNAKSYDQVVAFYADDAVSFPDHAPAIRGRASLREQVEKNRSKWPEGGIISFETLDVYGDGNTVTEVGKEVMRGESGNVISTGKYIAIFQKKDGKYHCIRDIYNSDEPMP